MHTYDAKQKNKFYQYQMRAMSPNLMLTKVTHYTVVHKMWSISQIRIARLLYHFLISTSNLPLLKKVPRYVTRTILCKDRLHWYLNGNTSMDYHNRTKNRSWENKPSSPLMITYTHIHCTHPAPTKDQGIHQLLKFYIVCACIQNCTP